jgi:hypothetical protein
VEQEPARRVLYEVEDELEPFGTADVRIGHDAGAFG